MLSIVVSTKLLKCCSHHHAFTFFFGYSYFSITGNEIIALPCNIFCWMTNIIHNDIEVNQSIGIFTCNNKNKIEDV